MKFFLDTANLDEIREVAGWGVLDGVTTNPSLVAKEGLKFEDLVRRICEICPGPVSAEAVSDKAPDIIVEGRRLAALATNVAVKIPITIEGLKAIKVLASEGVAVNTTLIFSPGQALLAAKAGARFVSPFIGRLDDVAQDGMGLIEEISGIFANYDFACQIIVASVRHPRHIIDAALIGADICTVPFGVMDKLVRHPLTDLGIERFLKDWGKAVK
jgi:transaldolase